MADGLRTTRRMLALVQGGYFLVGGLWALAGRRSFEEVTGPKVDYWLVRTVGALLSVIGAVLGLAAWRGRMTAEITALAMGTSGVLAASSAFYAGTGRIRKIYLLDACVYCSFFICWAAISRYGAKASS